MKKFFLLSSLSLFFLLLIDAHLTTMMANILPAEIELVSHLFFMLMIFVARKLSLKANLALFLSLGILYDAYYLDLLGVATVLFPFFAALLAQAFRTLKMNAFNFALVQLVLVFAFNIALYVIAMGLGQGGISFDLFVVRLLAPTLIGNIGGSLALYPILMKISSKTRHQIVIRM